jgi:hypothetical protein
MAPNKPTKNAFQKFLEVLKIKYLDGKNPIGRMQTGYGFSPSSNAALNIGKMLSVPYDRELRIRKGDPQKELRAFNNRLGQIERIHNTYLSPRVKLAD